MRLVFLIHRLSYSGAPKILAWVANQMARRGHDVHVVTFFTGEQAHHLAETVTIHSLNICQSGNRIIRNTVEMAKLQYRLIRFLNRLKPDGVISFNISGTYIHLGLNKLFGKHKIIFSERADPNAYRGSTSKVRFAMMGCASGTVFQTEGARAFFTGKIYENSTVIPNPVVIKEAVLPKLPEYQHRYKNRDDRIVTVGRLSLKQKRQDVLLDAFRIVYDKHPELKLVIYGDGEDKEKIQAMAEKKGLADSVLLAGRTDQVEADICSARAFALTSDFEGIPNALIEAMTVGVPCVATDCSPGGAALLIRDGENGFLVPCGDATAVALGLLKLIEDPQISDRFATDGPQIVQEFSEDRIADLWEQYILKVLMEGK